MNDVNETENTTNEVFYSATDLAKIYSVSSSTIKRWKNEGKLPTAVKIHGLDRYSSVDLEAMVLEQNPTRHQRAQKEDLHSLIGQVGAGNE